MNTLYKYVYHICFFITISFNADALIGQEFVNKAEFVQAQLDLVSAKYGSSQILVNGDYFEDIYRNDLGHPYLKDDQYVSGYIVLHGKKYDKLLLKYNAYLQSVVVQTSDNHNSTLEFVPPIEYVSEFSVYDQVYVKQSFSDGIDKFCQKVYAGNIMCVNTVEKKRFDSHHNVNFLAYKFTGAKTRHYVIIDNSYYEFASNKSYLRIFPKDHRKAISSYIKEQEIKINRSGIEQIAELVAFCDKLIYGGD